MSIIRRFLGVIMKRSSSVGDTFSLLRRYSKTKLMSHWTYCVSIGAAYISALIVHFKRLGSRISHDSFNQYSLFFSKQCIHCKTNARYTRGIFIRFLVRRFLNLFHEYRSVNGTLYWEKTCSATFSCRDLDTADE